MHGHHHNVPSYVPIESRFPTVKRSDGVLHLLVPVPRCKLCFKPIQERFRDWGRCYGCYEGSPVDGAVLKRVVAATLYIPGVSGYDHSEEIIELKESGQYADEYAEVLAYVLQEEGIILGESGLIVPIPHTAPRQGVTGPMALAESLSEIFGLETRPILSFGREVETQKGLSLADRKTNVEDSMNCEEPVDGRTIYLVDDVMTTGYTMREGAETLCSSGANLVIGVAAGRDANLTSLVHAGVLKRVER